MSLSLALFFDLSFLNCVRGRAKKKMRGNVSISVIYIEQQYLIGSSNQWLMSSHKDATNIIPQELALKIARGITSGDYVRAYIVLPMWPEGVASDASVQKILFFQCRTIEMMMKTVADAIVEANLRDSHPTDFLSFFCLGTREAPQLLTTAESGVTVACEESSSLRGTAPRRLSNTTTSSGDSSRSRASRSSRGSRTSRISASIARRLSSRLHNPRTLDEERLGISRRHPIYQHAKLFICDDEIALTGSSNLNERSMSGFRDTEIAVSVFQPHHSYKVDRLKGAAMPRGEVSRFRKRLWAEHMLGADAKHFPQVLDDPGTLECMREVQRRTELNWQLYTDPKPTTMTSHLLPYPYDIDRAGVVRPRVREFPDTRGLVTGFPSNIIPDILAS